MPQKFHIFSIICELNPPHNGHQLLFRSAREQGATHLVAVLSGNYVQRGTPACFSKAVRASCAVAMGADLVVELPLPYATGNAETFAKGGVGLLHQLGCVNTLLFGSECGDITKLQSLARVTESSEFSHVLHQLQKQTPNTSYATLRQQAVSILLGEEMASILATPNNSLGIAYCKALQTLSSTIQPATILRQGADYHERGSVLSAYPSATQLRQVLKANPHTDLTPYMPQEVATLLQNAIQEGLAPVLPHSLALPLLSYLRRLPREHLAKLPDCSEGLEDKLYKSIQQTTTLDQLYDEMKSKRYSHARVRRLVLSAFLGITKEDSATLPPYCRVLGCSQKGRELLSYLTKSSQIPLVIRHNDTKKLDKLAIKMYNLERCADDLYALCYPNPQPCGQSLQLRL